MNRDDPPRAPKHPALSGKLWDGAPGLDEPSTKNDGEAPCQD